MNIVGYVRVSTDQQKDSALGVEAQIKAIYNYAHNKGVSDIHIFKDEGVSGALEFEKRIGMSGAIEKLSKGSLLVVVKRDRIARNVFALLKIEKAVEKRRARIISIAGEGTEDDNDSSFLTRTMFDMFSEYERRVISTRTKVALAIKKAKNECVGYIPFGYQISVDGIHLEENPIEKSTLFKMQRLRNARVPIKKIAQFMNENYFLNRKNLLWNYMSVYTILRNNKK